MTRALDALGLALVLACAGWVAGGAVRVELDDALIYARYLRNFQEGHGLVYNPGERVNALTSPAFTALAMAVGPALGELPRSLNRLSALCQALAGVLFGLWISGLAERREGARVSVSAGLSAALVLGVHPFFGACHGLETGLFACAAAALLLARAREARGAFALCAGLALTARPEAVLLVVALLLDFPGDVRGMGRRQLVLAALPLALSFAFNAYHFGSATPRTALVKIGQGLSQAWAPWPWGFLDAGYHLESFWGGSHARLALACALALCGFREVTRRAGGRALLAYAGAYLVVLTLMNAPRYHWYYAPFYLVGLVMAAAGVGRLVDAAWRRRRTAGLVATALGLSLGVDLTLGGAVAAAGAGPDLRYYAVGIWLAEHAGPDDRVACAEIGTLGWYSRRPIVDMVGLVTPDNAWRVMAGRLDDWLPASKPEWLVLHRPAWIVEGVAVYAEAQGEYVEVEPGPWAGLRLLRRKR